MQFFKGNAILWLKCRPFKWFMPTQRKEQKARMGITRPTNQSAGAAYTLKQPNGLT